jgi:resuscitation-promoting factor RpfA
VEEGQARRALLAVIVLVAGEVLAVVALHRLGAVDGFAIPRRDLGLWLRQAPSEDVLLAGVRLAALVAAWWLLGSTLLYVAARLAHLHGTARAVGWATLPAVRRWVDRAAAVSIVAASALGTARPAGADPPPTTIAAPPPVVIDLDHRDRSGPSTGPPASARTGRSGEAEPPAETVPTSVPPPTTSPVAPPVPVPPPAPPGNARHTITPGDHLWSIAAAHLGVVNAADIAPYWRRLVEHNRSRLRSGDPNLVYPGEVVELPPL